MATTDPATLPALTTWYLFTNLAHPAAPHAVDSPVPPADLAEVVRLYGLRNWVEQSYRQMKQELGWADFMVRSDAAIRRHWLLVCCAFSFGWRAGLVPDAAAGPTATGIATDTPTSVPPAPEVGEKSGPVGHARAFLAVGAPPRSRLAHPLDPALALVAQLVDGSTAPGTPSSP